MTTRIGEAWRLLGVQLLNSVLLAAHNPTANSALHRDKVRGLGASWCGGGESARVVREHPEQCAGQRSNPVWLLSLLLVLLALVSVPSSPSSSCPLTWKLFWKFSSAHVTPSGAPYLRNS